MREFLLRLVIFGLVTLVAHRAEAYSKIHLSVGGELGVGEMRYYDGSTADMMIEFNGGVLTTFSNCGPPNPVPSAFTGARTGSTSQRAKGV